jgi:hypothetical protein
VEEDRAIRNKREILEKVHLTDNDISELYLLIKKRRHDYKDQLTIGKLKDYIAKQKSHNRR